MKPSDLLLFTATLAVIACSKSDAAKDAAVALPASTQDSAATAAAVAPVAVPAAVPAAPPSSSAGTVAKSKPAAVVAPSAKPSLAAKSVAPAAAASAAQPTTASATPVVAPVVAPVALAPTPPDNAADGKTVYTVTCQKCHGATGTPSKVMKAKFDKLDVFDAAFFANRSVDSVVTVLIKGKGNGMKSFEGKLSSGEMRAVASYIRSFGR